MPEYQSESVPESIVLENDSPQSSFVVPNVVVISQYAILQTELVLFQTDLVSFHGAGIQFS